MSRSVERAPSQRHRSPLRAAVSVIVAVVLLAGLSALPAAATATVMQDFETGTVTAPPVGWTVDSNDNAALMADGWQGWVFRPTDEVIARFGSGGDRNNFHRASDNVAVIHSDGNRPNGNNASLRVDSTLWSPVMPLTDLGGVHVQFDSHYKQGQAPQTAKLVAKLNDGTVMDVQPFASHRLNERVDISFAVPESATSVQIGWAFLQTNNNWFWMIDNVAISEVAPPPAPPTVPALMGPKPVVAPGGSVKVQLDGLRTGQTPEASISEGNLSQIPAADARGEVAFTITIPAGTAPGVLPLEITGDDIEAVTIPVSVVAPGESYANAEERFYFESFEAAAMAVNTTSSQDGWTVETEGAGWTRSTRQQVLDTYGTDRRQAFTRASGQIMVVEGSAAGIESSLTSPSIEVSGVDELELRFDSHYRDRGEQAAQVRLTFDDGSEQVLKTYDATEESAQPRLAFSVPSTANSVAISFEFRGATGSWMIDDVYIVRPLPELAIDAPAKAVVDVFSDVQGANARLRDHVLPGFRAMGQTADVIASVGDLVSQGYANQYDAYFNAFRSGGGDDYDQVISTIGNHEYYGTGTSDVFRERFLDVTGMREVGGQGGLWGEVLVDDELPVLWIGSEHYEYSERTGGSPFVEMSDEQFTWLQDRLAYWSAQNQPVLLFSHQLFPNTVSGTYINFYRQDFGQDEARVAALLSAHPNVIKVSGHTHWTPNLHDWSVEHRFDPAVEYGLTMVNTGSVTTMYGPSGDWGEGAIGGADPTGLRVAAYDDRVRVASYSFAQGGEATLLKYVDVPRPRAVETEEPTPTEEPTSPQEPTPTEEPSATESPSATEQPTPSATPSPTADPSPSQAGTQSPTDGATQHPKLPNTGPEVGILALVGASVLVSAGVSLLLRRGLI